MALTWCKGLQKNGWANQVGTWRVSISYRSKVKTVGIVKWHTVCWILFVRVYHSQSICTKSTAHELRIFKTSDSIKKHYSESQKLSQEIWVFKTYPFFLRTDLNHFWMIWKIPNIVDSAFVKASVLLFTGGAQKIKNPMFSNFLHEWWFICKVLVAADMICIVYVYIYDYMNVWYQLYKSIS